MLGRKERERQRLLLCVFVVVLLLLSHNIRALALGAYVPLVPLVP